MLQKHRPPDLHFVFLKADIPDNNIWIKGHFIFCCHLKKKKKERRENQVGRQLNSFSPIHWVRELSWVECHMDLPTKILKTPESQCANHRICWPYFDHDAMYSELSKLRSLLLWGQGEKSRSLTKYFLFH